MSSNCITIRYLTREAIQRWFERPLAVLARLVVVLLGAGSALLVLMALAAAEHELRQRLRSLGLEVLVLRSFGPQQMWDFRIVPAGLRAYGFTQLPFRAGCELTADAMPVLVPDENTRRELAMSGSGTAVLLSSLLPAGLRVCVDLDGQSLETECRPMPGLLRGLGEHQILLLGESALSGTAVESTRIDVLEGFGENLSARKLEEALRLSCELDGRLLPLIQSPVRLEEELLALRARRIGLGWMLAAVLGGSLAVVAGAIGVLEYREARHLCALLRSLGVAPWQLYAARLAENLLLANAAILAAVAAAGTVGPSLFIWLEVSSAVPWWTFLDGVSLACVAISANLGAALATVPVARALREPVGAVLC